VLQLKDGQRGRLKETEASALRFRPTHTGQDASGLARHCAVSMCRWLGLPAGWPLHVQASLLRDFCMQSLALVGYLQAEPCEHQLKWSPATSVRLPTCGILLRVGLQMPAQVWASACASSPGSAFLGKYAAQWGLRHKSDSVARKAQRTRTVRCKVAILTTYCEPQMEAWCSCHHTVAILTRSPSLPRRP